MTDAIKDYKHRLDEEMLKCMDGSITAQRMMTIKEINECWMELDERERRAAQKSERGTDKALTASEAHLWTDHMANTDGTVGAHWAMEQTTPYMIARGVTVAPETFWCVMCMMYSDYYRVARNHGVDTPDFYADMAAAFLQDADAAPNKAGRYYRCVTQVM